MSDDGPPPKVMRVLILGAGETGKSTIIKQLQVAYQQTASFDMNLYKEWIQRNTIESAMQAVSIAKSQDVELDSELLEYIEGMDDGQLTPAMAAEIQKLWKEPKLQTAVITNQKSPTTWILDQAPFYFENAARFAEAGYTPTDEDIVRTRVLTVGTKEFSFSDKVTAEFLAEYLPIAANLISGAEVTPGGCFCDLPWQLVDVGGQRNERRKWLHVLDDVVCLVWTVGLTEYSQVMREDASQKRILESLELFDKWANNKVFDGVPLLIVFTKLDYYEAQWDAAAFKATFPEFDGSSPKEGIAHLKQIFKARYKGSGTVDEFVVNTTDMKHLGKLMHKIKSVVATQRSGDIMNMLQKPVVEEKKKRTSMVGGMMKRMSLTKG